MRLLERNRYEDFKLCCKPFASSYKVGKKLGTMGHQHGALILGPFQTYSVPYKTLQAHAGAIIRGTFRGGLGRSRESLFMGPP